MVVLRAIGRLFRTVIFGVSPTREDSIAYDEAMDERRGHANLPGADIPQRVANDSWTGNF